MPITRKQLLKRALVGAIALSVPKIPALGRPDAYDTSIVRITSARTAIPSAARYEHSREQPAGLMYFDETAEWQPDLYALTAQNAHWLEDELLPRQAMAQREVGSFLLPPQTSRFFRPQDILRDEYSGENFYVSRVDHDKGRIWTEVMGKTQLSVPIINPRDELVALRESHPAPEPGELLDEADPLRRSRLLLPPAMRGTSAQRIPVYGPRPDWMND